VKFADIRIIGSALNAIFGWSWPVVLLKALIRKKAVLSKTRWSDAQGPESEFVKRISLAPALYLELGERAGTPELTKLFCEVDRRFFPKAFPGLRFHRGDSWENTIACGKDRCESVFEKIDS